MKVEASFLNGAFLITPEPRVDGRGFFSRLADRETMERYGMNIGFSQISLSHNNDAGTLRGIHFQLAPYEEEKLILCVSGAVFDVIVDLRTESPTYLKWQGFELSGENAKSLYVPKGFAHGYQTLQDRTRLLYHLTGEYMPESATGCRWDDPKLDITWPRAEKRIMAEKDLRWNLL